MTYNGRLFVFLQTQIHRFGLFEQLNLASQQLTTLINEATYPNQRPVSLTELHLRRAAEDFAIAILLTT